VVAQNAAIELTLGRGVRVRDVIGYEWNSMEAGEGGDGRRGRDSEAREGRILISIGDLYSNERREVTVELQLPGGTGSKRAASGHLMFHDREYSQDAGFTVDFLYSDDVAELERSRDWDVQGKADVAISTRKVENAVKALDAGRSDLAEKEIKEAQKMLESSAAISNSAVAAPMMQEQIRELESFRQEVQDSSVDRKKVKKSMQYHNYRTQKKKVEEP